MVIVFGSLANSLPQAKHQGPFGFKARVEFKTGNYPYNIFIDFNLKYCRLWRSWLVSFNLKVYVRE